MLKVVMSSAEFGAEDFTYDSIEEAREGFEAPQEGVRQSRSKKTASNAACSWSSTNGKLALDLGPIIK